MTKTQLSRSRRTLASLAWAILLASGCGDAEQELPRRIISGSVTFAGESVPAGEIRFVPIDSGPVSVARITDGVYRAEAKGGVLIGEMRVEIIATSPAAEMTLEELDRNPNSAAPVAIPIKYNKKSNLKAIIEAGDEPQVVDFALEK